MKNNKFDENKPESNWATWALLNAALTPGDPIKIQTARDLCVTRLAQLVGENPDAPVKCGPRSFVILTNGYWGRGKTPQDAAKECVRAGASKTDKAYLALVINDDTPEVNGMGSIISDSESAQFNIGMVGTIGGILRAA